MYTFTLGGEASIIVVVVVITDVEVVVVVVSCWPMLTWRCATKTKSLIAAADRILLLCLKIHTLERQRPKLLD